MKTHQTRQSSFLNDEMESGRVHKVHPLFPLRRMYAFRHTEGRLAKAERRKAFSLVEVTMALGILSFCIVAIMGLLLVALKVSRQSIEKNIETRILQSMRAELLQAPFSALPLTKSVNYHGKAYDGISSFDADGYRLTNVSPSAEAVYYNACFENVSHVGLPASQTNEKVITCKITIYNKIRNNEESSQNAIYLPDNGF